MKATPRRGPIGQASAVAAMFCLSTLATSSAWAFYETDRYEIRANLRLSQAFALDGVDGSSGALTRTSLRLMIDYFPTEWLAAEMHLLQSLTGSTKLRLPPPSRDRFARTYYDRPRVQSTLLVDRLSVRFSIDPVTIRIGRQPISLATVYFFTPNDFFAPFAPDAFFRLYKPGVDAARIDISIQELSELTVIGALPPDAGFDQASGIAAGRTVIFGQELRVLGGRLPDRWVAGAAFSGEIAEWLGVRAEGHASIPDDGPATAEIALSVERRFENSINAQLELFYHGAGASRPEDYVPGPSFLGKAYLAAGVSYEFTPLLLGNALVLLNLVDGSGLFGAYASYSLSDEIEGALSVNIPFAAGDQHEFKDRPAFVDLEIRAFF